MGRRQVVRHRVLVPTFLGSNPSGPVLGTVKSFNPILVFDFDGVIVNGIDEYWFSSRAACLYLLRDSGNTASLPHSIPKSFKKLRPWIHEGWEMVLLAAEILRPNSSLILQSQKLTSADYSFLREEALKFWEWNPLELQNALERSRKSAIKHDKRSWLNLHQPFPHVVKRINQLADERIPWAVLTTKGAEFTKELLQSLDLKPDLLFGHESGSKSKVLKQLIENNYSILGFVEDRLETLETIINTPELSSIPCYLASWGYLKPSDQETKNQEIHLLKPETFATPLANWN